jgi:uncharacterized membrane protein YqaE (UPF0057 family)
MKKSAFVLVVCLALVSVSVPSFAVYLREGYFSNDFIMSKNLSKSQVDLSAQIEYTDISAIYNSNTDGMFDPVHSAFKQTTLTVVPLKAAYGITDDLSVRITFPLVSWRYLLNSGAARGDYGLGDIRLEGLYNIAKENGNMPSIAVNVGVKAASGKNWNWLGKNEYPPIGTGSTDLWISGIFTKNLWGLDGKALVGYYFPGVNPSPIFNFLPGTELLCSASLGCAKGQLEYGGEIWGAFAGPIMAISPVTGPNQMIEDSEISKLFFSPYVNYKMSDSLLLKAVADIPFGTPASKGLTPTFLMLDWMRGATYTIGATWTI